VNRAQLEVEIEEEHCKLARKAGWVVDKIMKTGRGGFPDRFYAREGRVVLIEFKRPKGRITKQQLLRHRELRDAGLEVHVVYSLAQAELVLRLDDFRRGATYQSALDL
jgi:hypothetical protein